MTEFLYFIIGGLISWVIAHFYYGKGKKDLEIRNTMLEQQLTNVTAELKSANSTSKLAINEQRMSEAVIACNRNGTPEHIIDTYTDLSMQEKEEMFDKVVFRAKRRKATYNPYKNT